MKFAKVFFVAASALALGAHAQDQDAKTPTVELKLKGASGGMVLFPNGGDSVKDSVAIEQGKLEEIDATGKKVKDITMQNGAWSAIETEEKDGKTVYTSTFVKTGTGNQAPATFTLKAHLARETSTVQEERPCSQCAADTTSGATTEGDCQKASPDLTCTAKVNDACPEGFALCTETVEVVKDQLKFSIIVEDWVFADPANKLHYQLVLKSKGKGSKDLPASIADDGTKQKKTTFEGGYVVTPTTAKIVEGATDQEVDVEVTTNDNGNSRTIDFKFASWGSGKTLYYDPDVGLSGASSVAVAGPLATLLLAVAAWCAM